MNAAHLHLVVIHFPIALPFIGLPLAIYGAARGQAQLQRLGLGLLALVVLFIATAYFSGGQAYEVIKDQPGVLDSAVEAHGLAAQWAMGSQCIVAVFSLVLLARSLTGRSLGKAWWIPHAVVSLWGLSVILGTAMQGGYIKHSETRGAAAVSPPAHAD